MDEPHRVVVISGDGIGPEVVSAARRAVDATGVRIAWDERPLGRAATDAGEPALPPATLVAIQEAGVALKGPVETPEGSGLRNVNVALRQTLDLYACVRPCRRYPGVPSPYPDVDLVVVRENTEDVYTGVEFEQGEPATLELIRVLHELSGSEIRKDSGVSIKAISREGSERIVRFAFRYAADHGRRTVTAAHKANIMKLSDGLFLEVAREVAREFDDVAFEDRIIDALCLRLVQRPDTLDVLVMPNLYGDIVSEVAAGLIGGVGLAPGAHIGDGVAVFEATHGTAPRLAGTDRANPVGVLLSAAMMLHHLGEAEAGDRLESAVAACLAGGEATADVAGEGRPALGTRAVADGIIARLG